MASATTGQSCKMSNILHGENTFCNFSYTDLQDQSMTFCNSTLGARSPTQTGAMLKPSATRGVVTWRPSPQMTQTTTSWRRRPKGLFTSMFGLEGQTEKWRGFGGGPTAVPGSSRSGTETNQTMAEQAKLVVNIACSSTVTTGGMIVSVRSVLSTGFCAA